MFIVGSQACQNSWKCVKNGKLGLMGIQCKESQNVPINDGVK